MTSPFIYLEATGGFEPPDKGFADLCLTTWLRRLTKSPKTDDLYTAFKTFCQEVGDAKIAPVPYDSQKKYR